MRFRLRFSIRDLLGLTVVVALAVGWWISHQRLANENEQLTARTMKVHVLYEVAPAVRVEILKKLQDAYSDEPEVLLVDDPTNSGIMVGATSGEHNAINLAIRAIEQNLQAKQTAVAGNPAP